MQSRKDGEFAHAPPDDGAIARFLDGLRDVLSGAFSATPGCNKLFGLPNSYVRHQ